MFNYISILSVLFLSLSSVASSVAADCDSDWEKNFEVTEEDIAELRKLIDGENQGRGLLMGKISLGETEYNAELHHRRDVLSQLATSFGGQPSYYKLEQEGDYVSGVKVKFPVLRGRLKMKIADKERALRLDFYPYVENSYEYSQNVLEGEELFVVYIPLHLFGLSADLKSPSIGTSIELSAKNEKPKIDEARFYYNGEDKSINKITLNLEFKDVGYEELAQVPGLVAKKTGEALSSTFTYLANGFWGIYNKVGTDGVVPTLTQAFTYVDKVAQVVDGVNTITESAKNGTLYQDARKITSEGEGKKVKDFLANATVVAKNTNAIVGAVNDVENEKILLAAQKTRVIKERVPLEKNLQEIEISLKAANQVLLNLKTEKAALDELLSAGDLEEGAIEDIKKELLLNQADEQKALKASKIISTEKDIAQLHIALFDAEEAAAPNIQAQINAKTKILTILKK